MRKETKGNGNATADAVLITGSSSAKPIIVDVISKTDETKQYFQRFSLEISVFSPVSLSWRIGMP